MAKVVSCIPNSFARLFIMFTQASVSPAKNSATAVAASFAELIAIAFRKGGVEEMVSQVVLDKRIGRNAARRTVAREAIGMMLSGLS